MLNVGLAQPRIIDDLKTILQGLQQEQNTPAHVTESVERGLKLIEEHKAKPEKFRKAMAKAIETLHATPVEVFQAIGSLHAGTPDDDTQENRERMYFANTMGQFERMDIAKANAFIEANPEAWRTWQESAKFWQAELS